MKTSTLEYVAGNTSCKGYLAFEEAAEKKPIVLIASTWLGLNSFTKEKAHYLAKLGYVVFAVDVFGGGKTTESTEEAVSLIKPLFMNRPLLLERMQAGYETAKTIPQGDSSKMGAIGFCFGGLCVIELLKSGPPVHTVSFHGVLSDTREGQKATLSPQAAKLNGSLLLLHGYKDPLVPMEDLVKLQNELSKTGIDWEVNVYGAAGHSFTNQELHNTSTGLYFEPIANKRSFIAMENYFKEKFS